MIGFLALTIAIIVPAALGYGVLRLAAPAVMRRQPLEQLFLAGVLGLGLLTAQILVYSRLDITRSFWSLVGPWAVVLAIMAAARRIEHQKQSARSKGRGRKLRLPEESPRRFTWPRLNAVDIALLVVLAVEVFSIATMALNELVWGWDTMVNWSLKAKVYYLERQPDLAALSQPAYPLCVPLMQTWVFHCLGGWNDAVGKGIFIFPFIIGGCGFYAVLKSLSHRTWALAATAALLATPRLFFNLAEGYADASLALVYGPGVLLLCRWLVRGDRWDLWAGAGVLGLCAWIKAEGLPLALIALVLALAVRVTMRPRWSRGFLVEVSVGLVLVLLGGAVWAVVAKVLDLGPVQGKGVFTFAGFFEQFSLDRIATISQAVWDQVHLVMFWGVIWFVWPVAAAVNPRRLVRAPSLLLVLAVLADFAMIFAIFITTRANLDWHLSSALERLLISLLPLMFALTTIQAYGLFQDEGPIRTPAASAE